MSDPALAEDLTAQTFLQATQAVRRNRAWRESVSGYIYRIAHNLVIDHYRRRDQRPVVSIDDVLDLADGDAEPHQAAERAADAAALHALLARLTHEQADVIRLKFLEGYSHAEIAAWLGRSEGAVKALQHRGVVTLRRLATTQGGELDGQRRTRLPM